MINSLELKNFRKFNNLKLTFNQRIIILEGKNATGKTSVLEAIYFVATTKSHRTNETSCLIKNNEEFALIQLNGKKHFKIIISKNGKVSYINNILYPKISEFIGNLDVIMFSPDDIELITGSKAIRRRFLDLEISLLDKSYLRFIMDYKKLLKERNNLLKEYDNSKKTILNVITNQLIEKNKIIYVKRNDFLMVINNYLVEISKKLNCEKIELSYMPTFDINNIEISFFNKLNYDILSKTTNIGIHRDEFIIKIDNKAANLYASEGQKRIIVLAIKLAIKEIYKRQNKEIILLLDDVFASVDQSRINNIMRYIKDEYQTFITTTSLFNIPNDLLKDAEIINL